MRCRGCENEITELDFREWEGFCPACCESGRMFDEDVRPLQDADTELIEIDYQI